MYDGSIYEELRNICLNPACMEIDSLPLLEGRCQRTSWIATSDVGHISSATKGIRCMSTCPPASLRSSTDGVSLNQCHSLPARACTAGASSKAASSCRSAASCRAVPADAGDAPVRVWRLCHGLPAVEQGSAEGHDAPGLVLAHKLGHESLQMVDGLLPLLHAARIRITTGRATQCG